MSRWIRAVLICAAATLAAAFMLTLTSRWIEADRPTPTRRKSAKPSREDLIDELSDPQKGHMLRELGRYV